MSLNQLELALMAFLLLELFTRLSTITPNRNLPNFQEFVNDINGFVI